MNIKTPISVFNNKLPESKGLLNYPSYKISKLIINLKKDQKNPKDLNVLRAKYNQKSQRKVIHLPQKQDYKEMQRFNFQEPVV